MLKTKAAPAAKFVPKTTKAAPALSAPKLSSGGKKGAELKLKARGHPRGALRFASAAALCKRRGLEAARGGGGRRLRRTISPRCAALRLALTRRAAGTHSPAWCRW